MRFSRCGRARVRLIAKTLDPVVSSTRLVLTPDETYAKCPQLDVLCIPGGAGINALLADEETLRFIRRQAEGARFVTSVCTGALVLGAAGLLSGRRATTHWASHHILAAGADRERAPAASRRGGEEFGARPFMSAPGCYGPEGSRRPR
jgi:cyclohexyl-isocyanide hydratase